MEKRGLQIAEQFRYLQKDYKGDFSAEVLPMIVQRTAIAARR